MIRRLAIVAGGSLLAVASPASASSMTKTLPVNRLVVELPGSWKVQRALGPSNLDLLRSDEHGSLAVGITEGSCASFFTAQEATVGTLTAATPDYVPAGWEVRSFTKGGGYLGCYKGTGFTIAVEWWDVTTEFSKSAWTTEMKVVLTSLQDARRLGGLSARHSLLELPGLTPLQIPDAMRVIASDPAKDVTLFSLGAGKQVGVLKAKECAALDNDGSNVKGKETKDSPASGWRRWSVTDNDVFCRELGSSAYVVIAPPGDAATLLLLDSLTGEITSTSTGSRKRLPGTKFRGELPKDWKAESEGDGSHVTGVGGISLTVTKVGSCSSAGSSRYEPTWLDTEWSGTIVNDTRITLCTKTKNGNAEVSLAPEMLEGRHRRVVGEFLTNLKAASDWVEPPTPFLPFPFEFGATTVNNGLERGFGGRAALQLQTAGGMLRLRGEIGWDSKSAVSFDVHLAIGKTFFDDSFAMFLAGGRGGIGSGDTKVIGDAPYLGFGFRLGALERGGWACLNFEWLYRRQIETSMLYPDHEWRLGLEGFGGKVKGLSGANLEYRNVGRASNLTLGLYYNL